MQSPATGTLTKGGTVALTISDGPKLVEVPASSGNKPRKPKKRCVRWASRYG
ncbi:serine/Threonine protein kinase [Arthrobacter sp. Hiyo4]|nr:serine/Threonine protein kinase [Arthrobacter sp. Hiyo4]